MFFDLQVRWGSRIVACCVITDEHENLLLMAKELQIHYLRFPLLPIKRYTIKRVVQETSKPVPPVHPYPRTRSSRTGWRARV
jgi:hypothetical protein